MEATHESQAPLARRPARRGLWLGLVGPVVLVAVWALLAALGLFPESLFPSPLAVARGLALEPGPTA